MDSLLSGIFSLLYVVGLGILMTLVLGALYVASDFVMRRLAGMLKRLRERHPDL